jgi:hypothetical protein
VSEEEALLNESHATTAPIIEASGTVDNAVDADESELMEDVLDATIAASENNENWVRL